MAWGDNFTWITGRHTVKAGYYHEFHLQDEGHTSPAFGGSFSFAVDKNNPGDTNYPFSNALLGNFQTYSQSNRQAIRLAQMNFDEWFVQDSWRVNAPLDARVGRSLLLFPALAPAAQ